MISELQKINRLTSNRVTRQGSHMVTSRRNCRWFRVPATTVIGCPIAWSEVVAPAGRRSAFYTAQDTTAANLSALRRYQQLDASKKLAGSAGL